MPEEKIFPMDYSSYDSSCSQNDPDEDSENEEFFDPLPHYHPDNNNNNNNNHQELPQDNQNPILSPVELTHSKKKAMLELRCRVEDAILSNNLFGKHKRHNLFASKGDDDDNNNNNVKENLRDVKIWGVPLLPSKAHQGTDIVLMKFLKAKDYKVSEAFHMLRKTMKWRREQRIEEIVDEKFSSEHESMWSMHGKDKEGRDICYYMLDALKDKELRHRFLGSEEKCQEFMRWRMQCIERGVRKILFKEGDINSIIQIIDVKNSPALATREFEWFNKKLLTLLQENYPGLIYKNLIINVPVWFMAFHALNLRLLTQRSRNKVLFVRSGKAIDNLLKFVTPENLLVNYGGLKRENDNEFSTNEKVLEVNIKANATTQIQIPINEADVTVTWDLSVTGNEVTYKEEFIPVDDCSYKVLLQKEKKMGETVRNLFHIREPGKIVITIENTTFKKKKGFYRYKSKPSVPMYMS